MDRFLTVKPSSASFGAEGGTKTFAVNASGTWKITTNLTSWIHVTKSGNTVNLRVDKNNGSSQRTGTIEFVSGDKKVVVPIKQTGSTTLSVTPDHLTYDSSGGSKTINVTSNNSWSIGTGIASWGHLTKNGNVLTVRIDPNNSSSTRSDWFSIKAGNKEKRINISQSGMSPSLSVSTNSVSFDYSGGTKTITVSTNGTWEIGTGIASWGHLSKDGNLLYVKVDKNTTTSSRSDWFTIKAGDKEKRINISQSGNSPSLSVSTDNVSFDYSGGTKTIAVSTNGTWEIGTGTASWGHLSKNGNLLYVKIDKNTTSSSRSDWFTVKAGNKEKRINITQKANTTSSSKNAIIHSVKVDNNVDVSGKKGLSVKVSFNVMGMKDKDGKVSCYFYDANGKALLDTNNSYCTSGTPSYVAVSRSIKPGYDNSKYTDYEITIPYEELHLSNTNYTTLRVDVLIWDYSVTPIKTLARKENTTFTCIPDISYLQVDGSTSNRTKYFGESGGREYYSVSTNASSYETWGVPSWCSIENKSSSGFTLVCDRNSNRNSRSNWMLVKAAGKEIRIDITQAASSGPTTTITSIEQFHNVFNGYVKGMNIKLKFDVSGMQGRRIKATAWFYYADNTTKLNNAYGGQVQVSNSDTAPYENTTFTMTLFMPYKGLNMAYGWRGPLSFNIVIYDDYGNELARRNNNTFTYSSF